MIKKILCVVTLFIFSINSYSYQFDSITAFGDSLSDNGNLYKYLAHIIPKSPPYYEGRFSNGPVWIESLYNLYFPNGKKENFQDYAVGGAGAVISYKENLPYTLTTEVDDYLYLHPYQNADKTLFTVWIGANNYLNAPANVDAITTSVVNAIGVDVKRLVDHGAVMIMIVNLPDLGKTPEGIQEHHQAILTELTNEHNKKLLQKFNELKEAYPNVNFVYFDVYSLFNQLMTNPEQFSITNIQTPCYVGGFLNRSAALAGSNPGNLDDYLKQQARLNNLNLDEKGRQAILSNPMLREALTIGQSHSLRGALNRSLVPLVCTGFLFWDHVHPTENVHDFIAQYAKSALDTAGLQPSAQ